MKWNFPLSNFSQRQGFNDAGIETFKGSQLTSLSREICQNSLDARNQKDSVILEFSLFDFPTKDFPCVEEYRKAIIQSMKACKSGSDSRPYDFFSNALKLLDKPTIRCLRISDYNTTGLRGSDKDRDTDWYNLVKSSGSSDKKGKAGGSFGIGKYATFACSETRTVLYSTIDIDKIEATQGVARFVSFRMDDHSDDETQGIGFLGLPEKNRPFPKWVSFQKGFERSSPGTDIYVVGFKEYPEWDSTVLAEIVDGFMYAILEGHLEVKVHNTLLNKANIGNVIAKFSDRILLNTKAYYDTFTSKTTKWIEEDFEQLGKIKIGFQMMEEPSPKKVAMIRMPGMKVKEQDKLSNFASFAGVMVILGDKLNEFLRKLENPEHNAWQADRATTPMGVKTAKDILDKLKKFMKKHLDELLESTVDVDFDLPGLGNYFKDEEIKGEITTMGQEGEFSPKPVDIKPILVKHPKSPKDPSPMIEKTDEGENDEFDEAENGNGHPSPTDSTSQGKSKEQPKGLPPKIGTKTRISLPKVKFYRVSKDEKIYEVRFTTITDIDNPTLKLHLMGEQSKEELLPITYAALGDFAIPTSKNEIHLPALEQGKTYTVTMITTLSHSFSIEVGLYGNQK